MHARMPADTSSMQLPRVLYWCACTCVAWHNLAYSAKAGVAFGQGCLGGRTRRDSNTRRQDTGATPKKSGGAPARHPSLHAAGTLTLTCHNFFQQGTLQCRMYTRCACLHSRESTPRCMPFAQCHSKKIPVGVPACNPLGVKKAKITLIGLGVH